MARTGWCATTVVVLLALVSAGCGRTAAPPRTAVSPDSVCRSFAEVVLTTDTTVDHGPADAYRRASPYMAARLAAAAGTEARSTRWRELVEHQARTVIAISPYAGDALSADTAATAHRAWAATETAVGRDGWSGPPVRYVVYCTLERDLSDRWLVSGYWIE